MSPIVILVIILFVLIFAIVKLNIHPFIALILAGISLGLATGMPLVTAAGHLLDGFANTLKWIGIIMVLGTVIGEILNETGGAKKIANTVINIVGKKRVPATMGITGYIVAIPVFVDVAYIMLQSITESLSVSSKKNILVVGLSLAAGLTATHALLPPTPGPLAAAGIMEANMGKVIMINFVVAFFATAAGIMWATMYCKKVNLPYDDVLKEKYQSIEISHDKQNLSQTFGAFAPILLPIFLIALGSFARPDTGIIDSKLLQSLGIPTIALLIGILIASLYIRGKDKTNKLNRIIDRSIEKSAIVIIITGAGGAFGAVIKASQIGDSVASTVVEAGIPGFIFPFILAAALTTSTGSLTVSMVTSSSIVVTMLPALGLSPELAVALIGAGSFCVFHANSSFFWLLSRMHQIPPKILFKTYSVQSLMMGFGGGFGIFILWLFGIR
jgi:GntP family gluconate:H+ symporter